MPWVLSEATGSIEGVSLESIAILEPGYSARINTSDTLQSNSTEITGLCVVMTKAAMIPPRADGWWADVALRSTIGNAMAVVQSLALHGIGATMQGVDAEGGCWLAAWCRERREARRSGR